MKILVVDDDKEIVELLSIYIQNEGYEVEKAYNGKEALTKIKTIKNIDLINFMNYPLMILFLNDSIFSHKGNKAFCFNMSVEKSISAKSTSFNPSIALNSLLIFSKSAISPKIAGSFSL